ncbi:MAG: YtxH domain-containing protein [Bacteroidetes bacterium]|nr:MAG: YtxH domain-containing protein [Bacteroidota bacterium]
MKNRSDGSSFRAGTWGVILGAAAGFAVGLLLAPEEGTKIRRKIAYQLDHLSEQIADLIEKSLSPEEVGDARKDGQALVNEAQEKAERIRDDIDSLLGEIRESQDAS